MKQSFRRLYPIDNTTLTIDATEKVETIGTLVPVKRLTSLRGGFIRKNGYGSFRIVSEPHSKTRGRYPPKLWSIITYWPQRKRTNMTTYPDRFGVRRLLDALTRRKAWLTAYPDGTLIVRTCEPLSPAIGQQLQEHGRELADLMRVWRECVPSRATEEGAAR
jgi:hypothetical protein